MSGGQGGGGEHIGGLVEGAAHVHGHQCGHSCAQGDSAALVHGGQGAVQGGVEHPHKRVDGAEKEPGQQQPCQGVEEHGLEPLQGGGQAGQKTLKQAHQVSGGKAGHQGAQESGGDRLGGEEGEGVAGDGQGAAHKTGHQRRPVPDGHGDIPAA